MRVKDTVDLEVTSAIVVDGQVVTAGAIITVAVDVAADLVRRGKAVRAGSGATDRSPGQIAASGNDHTSEVSMPAGRKRPLKA